MVIKKKLPAKLFLQTSQMSVVQLQQDLGVRRITAWLERGPPVVVMGKQERTCVCGGGVVHFTQVKALALGLSDDTTLHART